jgi:hypothetical protein
VANQQLSFDDAIVAAVSNPNAVVARRVIVTSTHKTIMWSNGKITCRKIKKNWTMAGVVEWLLGKGYQAAKVGINTVELNAQIPSF